MTIKYVLRIITIWSRRYSLMQKITECIEESMYELEVIIHIDRERLYDIIHIMDKEGRFFVSCNISQMENNMYIYELSVINEARLLHLGTSLMDLSERIASKLNLDSTFLVVKKCSWMEEWFRRLGYKESDRPLDDNGCITLEKKI